MLGNGKPKCEQAWVNLYFEKPLWVELKLSVNSLQTSKIAWLRPPALVISWQLNTKTRLKSFAPFFQNMVFEHSLAGMTQLCLSPGGQVKGCRLTLSEDFFTSLMVIADCEFAVSVPLHGKLSVVYLYGAVWTLFSACLISWRTAILSVWELGTNCIAFLILALEIIHLIWKPIQQFQGGNMDSSSQCWRVNRPCTDIMRNEMYTGAATFGYYIFQISLETI